MLASCNSIGLVFLAAGVLVAWAYPVYEEDLGDYERALGAPAEWEPNEQDYYFPKETEMEPMIYDADDVQEFRPEELDPEDAEQLIMEYLMPQGEAVEPEIEGEEPEGPPAESPVGSEPVKVAPHIVAGHTEAKATPKPEDKLKNKRGQKEKAAFLQNHEDKSKSGGKR